MRKISEISSDHADALNYIVYTYVEQGIKLNEALDRIQMALKIKPNRCLFEKEKVSRISWEISKGPLPESPLSEKINKENQRGKRVIKIESNGYQKL
jgi:hypothetical protein